MLAKAGGAKWIMVPQDMGYNYLFNGLNLLTGDPLGTLIHPAITVSVFFALLIFPLYLVFGVGDLEYSVVTQAEFYTRFADYLVILLGAAAIYALGRLALRGTRSLPLALLVQFSFMLASASSMFLASFATPEGILIAVFALIAGLSLASMAEGKYETSSHHYVVSFSCLIGVAVATKFIAAPVILLPLIMAPEWRTRRRVILLSALFFGLFMSPIFFSLQNLYQFYGDLQAIIYASFSERAGIGSGSFWANLSRQFGSTTRSLPFFFPVLYLEIAAAALIFAVGRWRRAVMGSVDWRLFFSTMIMLLIAIAYIMIRPKPHYLVPYAFFLGMMAILLVRMGGTVLVNAGMGEALGRRVGQAGLVLGLVLCGAGFMYPFINHPYGFGSIRGFRDDALTLNRMFLPIPSGHALVTAIHSSNPRTALEHANSTSRALHGATIGEVSPIEHFLYSLDGRTVTDINGMRIPFKSLMSRFSIVNFWTSNFLPNDWRRPPDVIQRTVFEGLVEKVVQILAVSDEASLDPAASDDMNAKNGWWRGECITGSACLMKTYSHEVGQIITHYRITPISPGESVCLPRRWRVEASLDRKRWQSLGKEVLSENWVAGQAQTFTLDMDRPFPFLRWVAEKGSATVSSWCAQVGLYVGEGGRAILFPSKVATVLEDDLIVSQRSAEHEKVQADNTIMVGVVANEPRRAVGYGVDLKWWENSAAGNSLAWIFEGSVDGVQWRELDRRVAIDPGIGGRLDFSLPASSDVYVYFRLQVTLPVGSALKPADIGFSVVAWPDKPSVLERYYVRGFWERAGIFPMGFELDFPNLVRAKDYALVPAPWGPESLSRMPSRWWLYGSRNGRNWDRLDVRTEEADWEHDTERNFVIPSPGDYRHYRFVFLDTEDHSVIRIRSLRLFEDGKK